VTISESDLCILIDSREQAPFPFTGLRTERVALTTGDYSVKGAEDFIALERKSLPDLVSCFTSGPCFEIAPHMACIVDIYPESWRFRVALHQGKAGVSPYWITWVAYGAGNDRVGTSPTRVNGGVNTSSKFPTGSKTNTSMFPKAPGLHAAEPISCID